MLPSGRYRFIAATGGFFFRAWKVPRRSGGTPFPDRGSDFQPASIVERSEDAKISTLSRRFSLPRQGRRNVLMAAHLLRVRPFLSLAPDAQSPHRAHDRDLVPGIAASRRLDAAISSLVAIALTLSCWESV